MSKALVKINGLQAQLRSLGVELLPDNKTHQHRMEIRSETSDRLYIVAQRKGNSSWECKCPGWLSHRHCKHLDEMSHLLNALGGPVGLRTISDSAPQKKLAQSKPVSSTPAKTMGGVTPESKDIARIESIVAKSKGDEEKMLSLCIQMAGTITDVEKAQRRAVAAKQVLPKSIAAKAYKIFWQE